MSHQPQTNAALRARAEHAAKYGAQLVVPAADVLRALNDRDDAQARIDAARALFTDAVRNKKVHIPTGDLRAALDREGGAR